MAELAVTLKIGATLSPELGNAIGQIERQLEAFKRDVDKSAALSTGLTGLSVITTGLKAAYKPVKVSADYQALIDAIAQRSGASAATEAELAKEVIAASRGSGIARDQVARLVEQMMDKGMSLQQARDNLGVATTFASGQGVDGAHTATLLRALQQAGLKQPQQLREGLARLVAQAREGGFDNASLAKWVPQLLPAMDGKAPLDSVRELGALLQSQMASANGADDAADQVGQYLKSGHDPSGAPPGDSAMFKRLSAIKGDSGAVLDADLARRLETSRVKWQQSEGAWDDLLRSVGDSARPVSDGLADGATELLRELTDLADACPRVVGALTAVAGVGALAATGYGAFRVGKRLFGKGEGGGVGHALAAGAASEPVNVYVTNWQALSAPAGGRRRSAKKSTKGQRKARQTPYKQPHSVTSKKKLVGEAALGFASGRASASTSALRLPGVAGQVGRGLLKRVPGGALVDGGLRLAQVYSSDGTPQEKAEGYGAALGSMGGTMAGAAAGAAIGSVVPVVGTLIGGLIGGFVGGMGGEEAGGWLGRLIGGEVSDKPALSDVAQATDAPVTPPQAPAVVAPLPANQQFTFTANMPVTFTNSLSDPSVLQQLEAMARRQLEELMRQARSAQLTDTPHIAI